MDEDQLISISTGLTREMNMTIILIKKSQRRLKAMTINKTELSLLVEIRQGIILAGYMILLRNLLRGNHRDLRETGRLLL
jgi:hypothetical protein